MESKTPKKRKYENNNNGEVKKRRRRTKKLGEPINLNSLLCCDELKNCSIELADSSIMDETSQLEFDSIKSEIQRDFEIDQSFYIRTFVEFFVMPKIESYRREIPDDRSLFNKQNEIV